ncbi:MAG: hypothetical protein ACYC6Y_01420 [Thermoguttaceae bacterium]
MDGIGMIILGGIGLLVVGGISLSLWTEKKRREAWQRTADELGLPFLGDGSEILRRCATLKAFDRGTGRKLYNVIQGDAGDTRITIGDYRFTTGSGKHRTTHVYTACVLESGNLRTPHCYLRPQVAFFDRLGALLGGQDINFDDDPEFSSAYVLQADTEAAARQLFGEELRSWFAARKSERFYFETRGSLLVFHYGKTRKPAEAGQLMQQALEAMGLLAKG